MYESKHRELKRISRAIANHKEALKKFETSPPQHPHEHEMKKISEQAVQSLQHQYNSVSKE